MSHQSIVDPLFLGFLFCIRFFLLEELLLVEGNCTFPQLSLLLKVFTLMGGMWSLDIYQLYYLFAGPSDRELYGHVSSIQAYHLLPSISYLFVRKHVCVDCWGSWSNILGHRFALGLSNLVSFCIVSSFFQHLCLLFLEDVRHFLSLSLSLFRSFNDSASLLYSFVTLQISP